MGTSGLSIEQLESLAGNLQQRIGQLVSQYETDIALIKTEFEQTKMELKQYQDAEEAQKTDKSAKNGGTEHTN